MWLENDLDAALAQSKRTERMLLVWWTAGWCPPCNELKLSVFDQSPFAAHADRLVLVAIDGDARGAQTLGERLRVRSYPSTVLLDTQGRERLRFPGGLTAPEFCRILDIALTHPAPIAEIAERAAQGEALTDADYELIAYHWWAIDEVHAVGAERVPLLLSAFKSCPAHLSTVRLRLLVQLLGAASRRPGALLGDEGDMQAMRELLCSALRSSEVRFSNLYFLLVDLAVLDGLAADGTPAREVLNRALLDALERMLRAQSMTTTERLIALMAVLNVEGKLHARKSPDPAMQERVRDAAMQADRISLVAAERQTTINMAGHLLRAAGLTDEARQMFTSEVKRSVYPGYFMPYLAEMSLEEGRVQEAIDWWRGAYESTPLGASRFSRGVRHISQLIKLRPEERALIEREVTRVLAEIGDDPAALSGINRSSMEMLFANLARLPSL